MKKNSGLSILDSESQMIEEWLMVGYFAGLWISVSYSWVVWILISLQRIIVSIFASKTETWKRGELEILQIKFTFCHIPVVT